MADPRVPNEPPSPQEVHLLKLHLARDFASSSLDILREAIKLIAAPEEPSLERFPDLPLSEQGARIAERVLEHLLRNMDDELGPLGKPCAVIPSGSLGEPAQTLMQALFKEPLTIPQHFLAEIVELRKSPDKDRRRVAHEHLLLMYRGTGAPGTRAPVEPGPYRPSMRVVNGTAKIVAIPDRRWQEIEDIPF